MARVLNKLLCLICKQPNTASRVFTTSQMNYKVTPKNLKGKKKGRQEWLIRQFNDPYVKRAHAEQWRCRSAFKLIEMDDKYRILKPGDVVIDCGAAPGSWCQVAVERVNGTKSGMKKPVGLVIGVDLLHIDPIDGVILFTKSDFTDDDVQKSILETLGGKKVHVVLSDMAPNASDGRQLDHEVIVSLCASVLRFSVGVLNHGGHLLCKLWMGAEQHKLHVAMDKLFESVKVVKPPASRSSSSEIYFLAKGFKGVPSSQSNDRTVSRDSKLRNTMQ